LKKYAIFLVVLLLLLSIAGSVSAENSKPIIRADKTTFDPFTGIYVLTGNCYLEVRNRIITAGEARVSITTLEVWGSGGVTVTQDDISFSGDSVYVYGSEDRAKIDGGVNFSRTNFSVVADRAEYNWKTKIGVFTGNVQVTQNDSSWSTDSLVYNVETNTII
jgi:lipopolysaccharide export system protein LptA